MLRQRAKTAVMLAVPAIIAVLWLPTLIFAVLLLPVLLLAAAEWHGLTCSDGSSPWPYAGMLVLAAVVLMPLMLGPSGPWPVLLALLAVAYWGLVLVWLHRYSRQRGWTGAAWGRSIGVVTLLPAVVLMIHLHADPVLGGRYVMLLLLIVSLADIGAYLTGRKLGRRRLAPAVSPGKSWEGVAGGCTLALVVTSLLAWSNPQGPLAHPAFPVVVLLTVAASIVGDLFESLIKRHRGVKDSGTLLPGHGGVLDRIDSLTSATPVFVLGLNGLRMLQS